jgi:hypothetical protein
LQTWIVSPGPTVDGLLLFPVESTPEKVSAYSASHAGDHCSGGNFPFRVNGIIEGCEPGEQSDSGAANASSDGEKLAVFVGLRAARWLLRESAVATEQRNYTDKHHELFGHTISPRKSRVVWRQVFAAAEGCVKKCRPTTIQQLP